MIQRSGGPVEVNYCFGKWLFPLPNSTLGTADQDLRVNYREGWIVIPQSEKRCITNVQDLPDQKAITGTNDQ